KYREQGPVHEVVWAHGAKVWLVTQYDAVRALTNDPRVSKDGRRMSELFAYHSGATTELAEQTSEEAEEATGWDDELTAHMLNSDPPRHTRLRALVGKAFTLQRVERLRPRVEQVVDELLDRIEGRAQADLVSELAIRLPITIICELFGIPEEDREKFRLWSVKLVGAGQDADEVAEASQSMVEYASALVDERRKDPRDDMVSELVRATEDGDRLTQGELVSMIFVLVVAGHITTIYSIGNAASNLLTHPAELAKLRADLSLMPRAVDELLRFDGPSGVGTFRFTKDEIQVGDAVIPAGQLLALSWHSANRDDARFPDADRLDITRKPTGSLAFGFGLHHCIGIPLAKMQIETALARLITRFPDLRLAVAPDELEREPGALLRGLVSLPVLLTPVNGNPPRPRGAPEAADRSSTQSMTAQTVLSREAG
ncbi:MAG: cytochrome P450, partial [Blastococcus sp.]